MSKKEKIEYKGILREIGLEMMMFDISQLDKLPKCSKCGRKFIPKGSRLERNGKWTIKKNETDTCGACKGEEKKKTIVRYHGEKPKTVKQKGDNIAMGIEWEMNFSTEDDMNKQLDILSKIDVGNTLFSTQRDGSISEYGFELVSSIMSKDSIKELILNEIDKKLITNSRDKEIIDKIKDCNFNTIKNNLWDKFEEKGTLFENEEKDKIIEKIIENIKKGAKRKLNYYDSLISVLNKIKIAKEECKNNLSSKLLDKTNANKQRFIYKVSTEIEKELKRNYLSSWGLNLARQTHNDKMKDKFKSCGIHFHLSKDNLFKCKESWNKRSCEIIFQALAMLLMFKYDNSIKIFGRDTVFNHGWVFSSIKHVLDNDEIIDEKILEGFKMLKKVLNSEVYLEKFYNDAIKYSESILIKECAQYSTRYIPINLLNSKTIEFRMFSSDWETKRVLMKLLFTEGLSRFIVEFNEKKDKPCIECMINKNKELKQLLKELNII